MSRRLADKAALILSPNSMVTRRARSVFNVKRHRNLIPRLYGLNETNFESWISHNDPHQAEDEITHVCGHFNNAIDNSDLLRSAASPLEVRDFGRDVECFEFAEKLGFGSSAELNTSSWFVIQREINTVLFSKSALGREHSSTSDDAKKVAEHFISSAGNDYSPFTASV